VLFVVFLVLVPPPGCHPQRRTCSGNQRGGIAGDEEFAEKAQKSLTHVHMHLLWILKLTSEKTKMHYCFIAWQ
jgi:hypothetical protein